MGFSLGLGVLSPDMGGMSQRLGLVSRGCQGRGGVHTPDHRVQTTKKPCGANFHHTVTCTSDGTTFKPNFTLIQGLNLCK